MKSLRKDEASGPRIGKDPSSGASCWLFCGISNPTPGKLMLWLDAFGCDGPGTASGEAVEFVICGIIEPSPGKDECWVDGF